MSAGRETAGFVVVGAADDRKDGCYGSIERVWIAFVVWFLVIAAIAVGVLALAHAESAHGTFSASIPDGQEAAERQAKVEEQRRGSARVVAPGMRLAPRRKVQPGSTASPGAPVKSVVATSSSVVEVKAMMQKKPSPVQRAAGASAAKNPSGVRQASRPAPARYHPGLLSVPLPQRRQTSEDEAASPLLAHLVSKTEQKENSQK